MGTALNPVCEMNQVIDALGTDLSGLMANAFVLLRRCESKLRDFKRLRQTGGGTAHEILESEIGTLLASTAEHYKRASAKARTARTDFSALVAQAVPRDCSSADAFAILSACRQTEGSFDAFEILIAEFERQLETAVDVFRKASSAPDVTAQATGTFQKLMDKVMGGLRG